MSRRNFPPETRPPRFTSDRTLAGRFCRLTGKMVRFPDYIATPLMGLPTSSVPVGGSAARSQDPMLDHLEELSATAP